MQDLPIVPSAGAANLALTPALDSGGAVPFALIGALTAVTGVVLAVPGLALAGLGMAGLALQALHDGNALRVALRHCHFGRWRAAEPVLEEVARSEVRGPVQRWVARAHLAGLAWRRHDYRRAVYWTRSCADPSISDPATAWRAIATEARLWALSGHAQTAAACARRLQRPRGARDLEGVWAETWLIVAFAGQGDIETPLDKAAVHRLSLATDSGIALALAAWWLDHHGDTVRAHALAAAAMRAPDGAFAEVHYASLRRWVDGFVQLGAAYR